MFSTGLIDGEARKCSTTAETPYLDADCRHHAKSIVDHVQDREQLLARCILHETSRFLVGLPVVWIVGGSSAYAVAASVAETRVGELVRGLLRYTRTDGNALATGFLLLLSWSELAGRLVTPSTRSGVECCAIEVSPPGRIGANCAPG